MDFGKERKGGDEREGTKGRGQKGGDERDALTRLDTL